MHDHTMQYHVNTSWCHLRYTQPGARLPLGKGQKVGVTRCDLRDSVGILINIRRLTLRSQFCFDKIFIGVQDATIVITYTDYMILQ